MNRLDTLDQELAHWQTAVATAQGNICALYEHPVYRALSGNISGNSVILTGDSMVRVEKAVGSIGNLLLLVSSLGTTVERAAALRQAMPLLFQADKIAEIEQLLRGPSIVLPPSNSARPATRGLLDETDTKPTMLTPAQALERMQPEFEVARDTLFAVNRAWTDLSAELDVVEAKIAALEALAGTAGADEAVAANATLTALKQSAREMRNLLRTDPLQATEALEETLLPRLAAVRGDLEKAMREREAAKGELGAARALAPQLLEIHAQAEAASADCRRKIKIDPSPPPPLDEPALRALGEWLDRLAEQIENGGNWRAARIGLGRWQVQVQTALATDRAALEAAEALLRERLSLRGWLDALQAKAGAHALTEEAELAEAAGQAKQLLRSRPTPLALARERVARFQALINARTANP